MGRNLAKGPSTATLSTNYKTISRARVLGVCFTRSSTAGSDITCAFFGMDAIILVRCDGDP